MLKNFLLFLAFWGLLFSEESFPEQALPPANLDGIPSAIVAGHVNVITGNFLESATDFAMPGVCPMDISRNYCSSSFKNCTFTSSWNHNYESTIIRGRDHFDYATWCVFLMLDPRGANACFLAEKRDGILHPEWHHDYKYNKGYTNTGQGVISAKTQVGNTVITYAGHKEKDIHVTTSSGNEQIYKFDGEYFPYQMAEEKTPNRQTSEYKRKKDVIDTVSWKDSKNKPLGGLTFTYKFKGDREVRIQTPTKEEIVYYLTRCKTKDDYLRYYVGRVKSPRTPDVSYEYQPLKYDGQALLTKINRPEGRFLSLDYYTKGENDVGGFKVSIKDGLDVQLERVKCLYEPVGPDGESILTHRFFYYPNVKKHKTLTKEKWVELLDGYTEVRNAHNLRTRYFYDANQRLTDIYRDHGTNPYWDYSRERFFWGWYGELSARTLSDAWGTTHKAKIYEYDSKYNITEDILLGNLTGEGHLPELKEHGYPLKKHEMYVKRFTYAPNSLNHLLSEDDGHAITRYIYHPNTDLVKLKLTCDGTRIKIREITDYDDAGAPILRILDNGSSEDPDDLTNVTERHITRIEVLKGHAATGLPKIVEECVLNKETGQEELLLKKIYDYTSEGWCSQVDTYDANGEFRFTESYDYNSFGQVTSEVNAMGHVIERDYDANGNLTEERGPRPNQCKRTSYDVMNRPISTEEHVGNEIWLKTTRRFNTLNQLYEEWDPQGNITKYTYDEFGRCEKKTLPNGGGVSQSYDIFDQVIIKKDSFGHATYINNTAHGKPYRIAYPDGGVEKIKYDLSGLEIEKIALNGTVTSIDYDFLKRPIRQSIYADGELLSIETYEYDVFHLLAKTDSLGRRTEIRYDAAGRKISETCGDSQIQFEYDPLGRLVTEKEILSDTDARITIKEYDLLNRVIEERIENAFGQIFRKSTTTYDEAGNTISTTRFTAEGEATTTISYDLLNRAIATTDPLGQTTHTLIDDRFLYKGKHLKKMTVINPLGQQSITLFNSQDKPVETYILNPFGVPIQKLKKIYDLENNLVEMISTVYEDGAEVREVIHNWKYDSQNRVIALSEAGLRTTRYVYNQAGQKTETIKPDGVSLYYTYTPKGELSTLRSSEGTIDYAYTYNAISDWIEIIDHVNNTLSERIYDAQGRLKNEKLANGLNIGYEYDRLDRCTHLILPDSSTIDYTYNATDLIAIHRNGYSHNYEMDTSGAITRMDTGLGPIFYERDLAARLTKINRKIGPTISLVWDAAGNLVQKDTKTYTYDDLYQLTSEPGHIYRYDSTHNRLQHNEHAYGVNELNQYAHLEYDANGNVIRNGPRTFTYDALDRLLSTDKQIFAYDPLDRMIRSGDELYLYNDKAELGAWGKNLRINGHGRGGDIGSAVLIEISGKAYIPIHDEQGSVIALATPSGILVDEVEYTAFGEESPSKQLSPWRFLSKRKTGDLLLFGRRFYDPTLGRWLTCDPLGYDAGINLYAYVENNPLKRFDEFGLFSLQDVRNIFTPRSHELLFGGSNDVLFQRGGVTYSQNFYNHLMNSHDGPRSTIVGSRKLPSVGFGFTPGIVNTDESAIESGQHASDLSGGYEHDVVFNTTHGTHNDIPRYFLARDNKYATPVVDELHVKWNKSFEAGNSIYIQLGHSEGVTNIRNALMCYDEDLRKRIYAIAVAPSVYIDDDLCGGVVHLVSNWDVVPKLDRPGRERNQHTTVHLKRHPDVSIWNAHNFQAETYRNSIIEYSNYFQRKSRK